MTDVTHTAAIHWPAVSVLMSLFLAWSGVMFGAIKWLMDRYQRHIDDRFSGLEGGQESRRQEVAQVERDLLMLRAELPEHYVRRDDYVRGQSIIEAKLDALANKIEQTRVEGARHDD